MTRIAAARTVACLAAVGLLTAAQAGAATIASYNFTSDESDQVGAANLSASNVTWQANLIHNSSGGRSNVNGNLFFRSVAVADSKAASLDNGSGLGDYVSFTVTPDAGFQFEFDTFAFNYGYDAGIREDVATSVSFFVQVVIDGVATEVGSVFTDVQNVGDPRDQSAPNTTTPAIDLSGLGVIDSAAEFRIYLFDASNKDSATFSRLDDFVLNGQVSAIPEPATLVLSAIGLMLIHRRRGARRRSPRTV